MLDDLQLRRPLVIVVMAAAFLTYSVLALLVRQCLDAREKRQGCAHQK